MKKILLWAVLPLLLSACSSGKKAVSISSGNGQIRVNLGCDNIGQPYFTIQCRNAMLLDTSYLGLLLDHADLTKGLTLDKVEGPRNVEETYPMVHGKKALIHYKQDEYLLRFANPDKVQLECQIRINEKGVAYRYRLPEGGRVKVLKEASSFGLGSGTKAWLQPMSKAKTGWKETNPSYEEHYLIDVPLPVESPKGAGFVYPALFRIQDNWLLLSETNVHPDYCGTRLTYDAGQQLMQVTMPQPEEVFPGGGLLPEGETPFVTPWRLMAIGELADIVESTLGTDLAAPAPADARLANYKPGLASWSWVLLKDDFTNYETSRKFIDYAASMNWPYCLIDADWDWKIGFERMQELVDYAAAKNVKILLWYNSSGTWNSTTYTPKGELVDPKQRATVFARLQKMGVAGVKIDFFGGDGQSMIAYYHDLMEDAAKYGLMVNFHGATLPRGWHRTYPNLMTTEAIIGQEFITFTQKNADLQPSHCAVIPFVRNVFDPMDFTPMVLDSIPNIHRRTTPAFELALPFLFTSGIQHIAEIPEGMAKMPEAVVQLLRDVPTQWDEVRFLSGYPGKDIVLARRKGDNWYIAGINGEAVEKTFTLDLSFVTNSSGLIFMDGAGGKLSSRSIGKGPQTLSIPAFGGFLIKI